MKDVDEGDRGEVVVGEVVVNDEVCIGDDENREGGAIRKIHDEGRDGGKEGGELGEPQYGGDEGGEVVNV